MIKKISTFLLSFVLTSCICTDADLKKFNWKYGKGYYFGDFINFDDTNLRNDTLFEMNVETRNLTAYAVITKTKNIYFRGHKEIEIKSLKTGETGTYFGK